jgi:hypothetical protein
MGKCHTRITPNVTKTKSEVYHLQARGWDRPSAGTRRNVSLGNQGGEFVNDRIPQYSGTPLAQPHGAQRHA